MQNHVDKTNTNQDYWEKILMWEWLWNIDDSDCELDIDTNREVSEILDLNLIDTKIDRENKHIGAYYFWKFIWEIYEWEYFFWNESRDHIWLEVSDKYRFNWVWRYLYELYDKNFWFFDYEYAREESMVKFLISMWYLPVYMINDINWNKTKIIWNTPNYSLLKKWYSCELLKP